MRNVVQAHTIITLDLTTQTQPYSAQGFLSLSLGSMIIYSVVSDCKIILTEMWWVKV